MLKVKKIHFTNKRKEERHALNGMQNEMWKELVQMDAIRLPKHINHWNTNNLLKF